MRGVCSEAQACRPDPRAVAAARGSTTATQLLTSAVSMPRPNPIKFACDVNAEDTLTVSDGDGMVWFKSYEYGDTVTIRMATSDVEMLKEWLCDWLREQAGEDAGRVEVKPSPAGLHASQAEDWAVGWERLRKQFDDLAKIGRGLPRPTAEEVRERAKSAERERDEWRSKYEDLETERASCCYRSEQERDEALRARYTMEKQRDEAVEELERYRSTVRLWPGTVVKGVTLEEVDGLSVVLNAVESLRGAIDDTVDARVANLERMVASTRGDVDALIECLSKPRTVDIA